MKKEIHPDMHPVIFRDEGAGKDFVFYSTMKSEEVEKVDGVDHFVIRLDISSASHPFFTGKQKLIDTSGRVEKFKQKMERVQQKNKK
ncbi:type B 50S ribosomal protein L31 [Candidatus Gracilibacteria bacterium]|nr:type B 50S ribosomal protein L31 [Candidatus Gracilibacteria bacterium]MCF7819679.1 type B 50S ribosomal protein L31 [Candidatus Gracilibacteria bacterium]